MLRSAQGITDDQLRDIVTDPVPFIVECGCHDGRDTERFLRLFPDCKIVAFEPDPRPLERHDPPGFHDRIGDDPRVSLFNYAVGSADQMTVLYRSSGSPPGRSVEDWDHSSSLRRPTGHLTWSPWCTFPPEKRIIVQMVPLDTVLDEQFELGSVDLLWADVQGGQRELLRGAGETLKRTRYLYIECHKRPMYDGEPTQDELIDLLSDFEPVGLYENYNFLMRNKSCS